MQNCLLLQAKIHAIGRQKYPQSPAKIPAQSQSKMPAIAPKNTCNSIYKKTITISNEQMVLLLCRHKFSSKVSVIGFQRAPQVSISLTKNGSFSLVINPMKYVANLCPGQVIIILATFSTYDIGKNMGRFFLAKCESVLK